MSSPVSSVGIKTLLVLVPRMIFTKRAYTMKKMCISTLAVFRNKTEKDFHSSTQQYPHADPIQERFHQASAAYICVFFRVGFEYVCVCVSTALSLPFSNCSPPLTVPSQILFLSSNSSLSVFLLLIAGRRSSLWPRIFSHSPVYLCDNPHYCRGLSLFCERVPIFLI